MAKSKNNFSRLNTSKLPALATGSPSLQAAKIATPKVDGSQLNNLSSAGSAVRSLNFGTFHSKTSGQSSGSSWSGLLNAASSGGASGIFGGGLLSTGALGFIGKLFGLFGGSSTPPAPTKFELPASQVTSLNIGSTSASSIASPGIQTSSSSSLLHAQNLTSPEQAIHSAQVIQVVKQALLTSSSLNDVISEI